MSRSFLGIDLGTSAVKIIRVDHTGTLQKVKASYDEISPEGWFRAICRAAGQMDMTEVCAIGLSSQVGTYVINGQDVVSWHDGVGKEELDQLKARYSKEEFIREISMPHPDIISYPLPRLMHFRKQYPLLHSVCQPKDLLCRLLTGNFVTDRFSFRGLAHAETGEFSAFFLKEIGIDPAILPKVIDPTDPAGIVTAEAAHLTSLPQGLPVYTGMNDYYCSLLGMGITSAGDAFDITGTSEHLGVIQSHLDATTSLVSSPYLDNYVHYGVTGSCGVSLDFGLRTFHLDQVEPEQNLRRKPPVFLPYLHGERAPIFDSDARGVFFGLESHCSADDLAYAILEGNVFTLYSIWELLGLPKVTRIIASAGATRNAALNQLKADLLDTAIVTLEESDTSALGAVIVAAVGCGEYPDLATASRAMVRIRQTFTPRDALRPQLLQRYRIFKSLYPTLKQTYQNWKEITL